MPEMKQEAEHKSDLNRGSRKTWRHHESKDESLSSGDKILLGRIRDYLKGYIDTEDVKNDPDYKEIYDQTMTCVMEFSNRESGNDSIRSYIENSLSSDETGRINDEVSRIKQESKNKQIDTITSEWVKEWHERKRKEPVRNAKAEEIRNFIARSFEPDESVEGISLQPDMPGKPSKVIRIISYSSAAAAIIAVVLLFRFIIPYANPDKIFARYYEPYYVASVVTRNAGNLDAGDLKSALESYRNRNYQLAAVQFSESLLAEPVTDLPRFYLGMSFIELKNYERAVRVLESLADRQGEFTSDAKWYLGLVFLKTGNKEKARECFEYLAADPGFYSERSEKILRRFR